MQRKALFLGAGASHAFGMPLTNQIMPAIVTRLRSGQLYEDVKGHVTENGPTPTKDRALSGLYGGHPPLEKLDYPDPAEDRATLADRLRELAPGFESIDLKYFPVTDILSLLDYMLISAFVPAPRNRIADLVKCRDLIERGIMEVLKWPFNPSKVTEIPGNLLKIGKWIYNEGQIEPISVISTNYDELIETELYRHLIYTDGERPFDGVNNSVNFGLSWRDCPLGVIFNPPRDYKYSILKLHGSVHWMKCDLCGWIICNDDYNFKNLMPHVKMFDRNNTCPCGHWPLQSVILAPSFVRYTSDPSILDVWRHAFEELRNADHWYFIGYSLPTQDVAIRSTLIRALKSRGSKEPPKIDVYEVKGTEDVQARYRAFFGDYCSYHWGGMDEFLEMVVDKKSF
jgi:hypothetical protein